MSRHDRDTAFDLAAPTLFGETIEAVAVGGRFGLSALVAEIGGASLWRGHVRASLEPVGLLIVGEEQDLPAGALIRLLQQVEALVGATEGGHVGVRGFADDEHRTLVVLEPLVGQSLRTLLVRDAPLSPRSALEVFSAICAAVGQEHRRGACFDGVAPEALLVHADAGAVRALTLPAELVADLAPLPAAGDAAPSHDEGRETEELPFYRAPEQLLGEPGSAAGDVFTLGVLLVELLTGEPPFRGHNARTLAARMISEPAPALAARLEGFDGGAAIDALLDRLLRKRPEERPADAEAALALLQSLGLGGAAEATT